MGIKAISDPNWMEIHEEGFENEEVRRFISATVRFSKAPSPSALGDAIIASRGLEQDWGRISWLPWPLAAALFDCANAEEVDEPARKARAGEFGVAADWEQAESRWHGGFDVSDVLAVCENRGEIGPYIREVGVPFHIAAWNRSDRNDIKDESVALSFYRLKEAVEKCEGKRIKRIAAQMAMFICLGRTRLDLDTVMWMLNHGRPSVGVHDLIRSVPNPEDRVKVYQQGHNAFWYSAGESEGQVVAAAFARDPQQVNLLFVMRELIQSERVPISGTAIASVRSGGGKWTAAAVVVEAGQEHLNEEQAARIAREIVDLAPDDEWIVSDAIMAARTNVRDVNALATLALALLDGLPARAAGRVAVFDALDDVLRRRTSNFDHLSPAAKEDWFTT